MMMPRYTPLLCLLVASAAAAQPVPDTLRAPTNADSTTVFGWTVDADADRVLVGARVWPPPFPRDSASPARADHHGAVFVYRRTAAGAWEVEGRLDADYISNEDCFSWAMDLRGDLAAVGAQCEYGENPDGTIRGGAVYLFRFDGAEWMREAKIYPSDISGPWSPQSYFGESVSLGEGYLVVGAGYSPNPSNPEEDYASGAAYIFERHEGTWTHTATLVNDDADAQVNEYFGGTVAAAGGSVFVGAPSEDAPEAANRGAVYVFERTGTEWTQTAKLVAPPPSRSFGGLLAVGGGHAGVGAKEGTYPIEHVATEWQVGDLLPSYYPYGPFGVARYGDRMLAFDYEPSGMGEVARLYVEEPAGWSGHDLDLSSVNLHRDELVSLTEAHAFIGIPTFEGGQVLIYDLGQFVDGEPEAASPAALALSVAPNPAASEATVRFELPGPGAVRLTVYDVLGREVARLVDGPLPAGPQAVRLATRGLAPGLYPVRLEAEGKAITRLVTVVR